MKKVLMIEDSSFFAIIIKNFILQVSEELNPKITFAIDAAIEEKGAIKLIKEENYCLITLDGNLANHGHGINVLKKIDSKIFSKIIVISTDEFFLKYCKENNIPAFDKSKLSENEEELIKLMKKIINSN